MNKGYKDFKSVPFQEKLKFTDPQSLEFNESELSEIISLMKDYTLDRVAYRYYQSMIRILPHESTTPKDRWYKTTIIKYNDEWYVCDTNKGTYLCDQFYSLLECIKNECL